MAYSRKVIKKFHDTLNNPAAHNVGRLDPNANYSALKNVRLVKPTLKRYLNSNVRSRFRKLEEEDFMTAIMLPVQRFRKSSASKVWSDSRKVI